ncbi:MAG: NAD(P)/FAD-dependent oxidoreductase [Desulfobacterales bacterium]|nr:NAD(P)/FAD-dependent oxidoreductase [Desulfobacterales bacterium]
MTDYESVVIGAGNGGLTAALGLARAGVKTLLLERHNIPGGCATSFVRGRFEFEVALHQLSGMGTESFPGPLRDTLTQLEVIDRLEFVQMPNLYRLVVPDQLDITLPADRSGTVGALKGRFPDDAEAIDRFFDLVYEYCSQWVGVTIFRDPEASPEKYPAFFKYAFKPSKTILDDFFKDPLLKTTLGMYWSYQGMPPSELSFGDFAIVLWAYIEFKPFHIKGGSQALSSTLLEAYLQAGGEVRFNCDVEKIQVSDGKIAGVMTANGDEITTRHVVSNASTLTTYVDLIDKAHVPGTHQRALDARSVGTSFVTLFIGFDCEPGDMDITETTNFLAVNTDVEEIYRRTRALAAPEAMLFSCYDVDDPDFSPPGTCQAALVGLAYAEPWLTVPPHQYADTKYRIAGDMLETLYRVFPKCRDHIEELEVATPITHIRYLGHPGGAAYGFDKYTKDNEYFLDRKSPIRGLFHVGAWSGMGGFQPTLMSGFSASRAVVRSLRS